MDGEQSLLAHHPLFVDTPSLKTASHPSLSTMSKKLSVCFFCRHRASCMSDQALEDLYQLARDKSESKRMLSYERFYLLEEVPRFLGR